MDEIEQRILFQHDQLDVMATMVDDPDSDPDDRDFTSEKDRQDHLARHAQGEWAFVGMRVSVRWDGITLGTEGLWGIEHGTVAEGTDADAWELAPAEYFTVDGYDAVQMGSPLTSVVDDALRAAGKALDSLETGTDSAVTAALTAARRWIDPNRSDPVAPASAPGAGSNDETHVRWYVRQWQRHGLPLPDGAARVIATWYQSPAVPALTALASTGAIQRDELRSEIQAEIDAITHPRTAEQQEEVLFLGVLREYAERHGDRGPVDGWAGRWVTCPLGNWPRSASTTR